MSPKEAIRRLETLDQVLEGIVVDAIDQTSDEILMLNQNQLYAGRLSDGSLVSPTYQEDPFFQSVEEAQGYSDWKDDITPNSERPPGVPNLFVNGQFYNSWSVKASADRITFESSDPNAADIEEKFSTRIYGLDDSNMAQYRQETFFPVLKEEVQTQTGLKFSA